MMTAWNFAMWQCTLNWNEIRSDLVIGSCPVSCDDIDKIITATDVNALLSLQSEDCRDAMSIDYSAHRIHAEKRGFTIVNTPMLDFNPPDQRRNLPNAVRTLTSLLAAGHKVYVHCTSGLNRSPLAVMAYLSFVEMVSADEALAFIRQSRPAVDPSWEAYIGCREDLIEALSPHVHIRAYYLAQQHAEADPVRNWHRAEQDVIRQAFLSPRSLPGPRLDPSRP